MLRYPRGRMGYVWALTGLILAGGCAQSSGTFEPPQAPGAKTSASQADLASFLEIRAPFGGQLSPDGTLYYIKRADQAYQLFAGPAGHSDQAKQITDFEDGISGYRLSPDGKHLVITASSGGDEQLDLYLMPTDTRVKTPLHVDRNVVYAGVTWRRDSSGFAYRANDKSPRDFYVYDYDLATGRTRLLFDSEGSNYAADYSRDGSKLIVGKYNSNSYQQVFEVNIPDGTVREITPPGVERRFGVVGYNAAEDRLVVATDYLGNFTNLAWLEIETREVKPLLTEYTRHDVDSAELNEDRSLLAAVINRDAYGELVLRKMDGLRSMKGPRLGQGLLGGLRFTGGTMLFSFYNARSPGTIYSWDVAESKRAPQAQVVAEDGGIDLRTLVLPRLVRYESFDGMDIPAFLYLPRDYKKGRPCPFIVSFHGGPEAQARPRFSAPLQYFLSRGFGVIQPNVRGSSGYGTAYMNMDNYQRRMDSVRDGLAAAHWLLDRGYSQRGRIGAYGGSYGGFMVMAAITKEPDLFGAACDYVGIVNFETFLKNTKDYRRHLREAEYGPLSNPEFLARISPIHQVDSIRTPLLVVHGRNDPRVPVGEAEQIAAALKERNREVELLIFDDEGHGVRKQPNRLVFYEKLVGFFGRHLGG